MSTLDSSMTSGDIITDHGPPFDCTDADLVLRSSDNVNFLVHKALLKFASSVIREFPFEITQEEDDLHDGKPVFPLIQEHSSTVDQFLRLIYPLPSRSWNSLAEIHAVLEMGRKYDVEQIPRRISDVLLHGVFMKEQPLGVYALACGYEMHAVAGRAARVMVTQSTPVHLIQEKESTVLSCMTGEELYELLQYYRAYVDTTLEALSLDSLRSILIENSKWAWIACQAEPSMCPQSWHTLSPVHGRPGNSVRIRQWWMDYHESAMKAIRNGTKAQDALQDASLLSITHLACCMQCRQTSTTDLSKFAKCVLSVIERKLASVEFTPLKAARSSEIITSIP